MIVRSRSLFSRSVAHVQQHAPVVVSPIQFPRRVGRGGTPAASNGVAWPEGVLLSIRLNASCLKRW